jgi:hypothetical protein
VLRGAGLWRGCSDGELLNGLWLWLTADYECACRCMDRNESFMVETTTWEGKTVG